MFKQKYTEINDEIHVSNELKNKTVMKMSQSRPTFFNRKLAVGLSACCLLIVSVLTIPSFFTSDDKNGGIDKMPNNSLLASPSTDVYALALPDTTSAKTITFRFQDVQYSGLDEFTNQTAAALLTGTSNQTYSPVSFYLSMSGLSQFASDPTIFYEFLGVADAKTLKAQVNQLLVDLLYDEDFGELSVHNAVWMDDSLKVDQAVLKSIANDYHLASYQMNLDDNRASSLIGQWIKEKSEGLLDPSFEISEGSLMELVNVIYYKDQWRNLFDEADNEVLSFTYDQQVIEAEYMQTSYEGVAYRNELFDATQLRTEGHNEVILIKPTQATTLSELCDLSIVNSMLESSQDKYKVNLKVPKFSFESEINLMNAIPKTIQQTSDYLVSPEMILGNAYQKNNFSFTENGIEASSASVIELAPTASPPSEVEVMNIIYDQPFMVIVRDTKSKIITFVSIVHHPN